MGPVHKTNEGVGAKDRKTNWVYKIWRNLCKRSKDQVHTLERKERVNTMEIPRLCEDAATLKCKNINEGTGAHDKKVWACAQDKIKERVHKMKGRKCMHKIKWRSGCTRWKEWVGAQDERKEQMHKMKGRSGCTRWKEGAGALNRREGAGTQDETTKVVWRCSCSRD